MWSTREPPRACTRPLNGGKTFRRMTGADVIVNDVFVDPRDSNRVLLATDRGGVLASQDGGETFTASNSGISERKVEALAGGPHRSPAPLRRRGERQELRRRVRFRATAARSWSPGRHGLDGRDVFALAQTKDGTVLAGTNSGIFVLDPPAARTETRSAVTDRLRTNLGAAQHHRQHHRENRHRDASATPTSTSKSR